MKSRGLEQIRKHGNRREKYCVKERERGRKGDSLCYIDVTLAGKQTACGEVKSIFRVGG